MATPKHEKSFVNYDKTYETNVVGVRGIVYFAVGLVLLIGVTFGLMLVLQNVLEDHAKERDQQNVNPMQMNAEESLPPEPRLQTAPGFGVGEGKDRVNLELKAPQSEYQEVEKQWEKTWKDGERDPQTGTIITLPIDEAKQRLLQENVKAKADGQQELDESREFYSYSSSGRLASDKRR